VLDALELLATRHAFTADDVDKVIVRLGTRSASVVSNREMPNVCLQHVVAVMLLDGTVSFHAAHDVARMHDPSVLRARAKVEVVPDDELERRAPRREAIVTLVLNDGAELSQHVQAVRGTADNPMPREEVVAKGRDLMTPVLGARKCAGLIERVLGLESIGDVRDLRPFLQPTG
jgi:2-methylcitrate dehydratase PrpD